MWPQWAATAMLFQLQQARDQRRLGDQVQQAAIGLAQRLQAYGDAALLRVALAQPQEVAQLPPGEGEVAVVGYGAGLRGVQRDDLHAEPAGAAQGVPQVAVQRRGVDARSGDGQVARQHVPTGIDTYARRVHPARQLDKVRFRQRGDIRKGQFHVIIAQLRHLGQVDKIRADADERHGPFPSMRAYTPSILSFTSIRLFDVLSNSKAH